ncbi:MAG TPA: hypothetical protein VI336_01475 [Candidatus Saccharimonadales bacterium]|nr:hypothetical protein [Candidatus Saccharimonadales bacterium]
MNPTKASPPQQPKAEPKAVARLPGGGAKKNLNLDFKKSLPKLKKLSQKITAHLSFIIILVVLLIYMLVVWQIRGLVTAEPSAEDESLALASTDISKIDKDAIEQIQSLEQNSPQVRTLFTKARNNPFHE